MKALQVLGPVGRDACNQLLWGDTFGLGLEHDRRPVRVIGTEEMHDIAEHPLEADPDIGLDVLHDVADMEWAVGVGQSSGDKKLAGHRDSLPRSAAGARPSRVRALRMPRGSA